MKGKKNFLLKLYWHYKKDNGCKNSYTIFFTFEDNSIVVMYMDTIKDNDQRKTIQKGQNQKAIGYWYWQ